MTTMSAVALGGILAIAFVSAWTWWRDVSPGVSWSAFWQPVRDVSMHGKPWMTVHLVAHLLGGAAFAMFMLGPWFSPAWLGAWWQRGIAMLLWQGLWERIQHENWKKGRGSSDYPWWSAVWDVMISVAAWVVVEIVRAVVV